MRGLSGIILLIAAFTGVIGCEEDDGDHLAGTGTKVEICEQSAIDEFELAELVVNGDTMELTVRYGGGCEEHYFKLCWDGAFMESEPVQARLNLIHDSNGDACEAYITDTLAFDLIPMKSAYQSGYQSEQGEIVLHLVDQSTSFVF